MIELIAAVAGASITVAAARATGILDRNAEARDAIIRLTSSLEHIAQRLDDLHADMKEDRKEYFSRLSNVEQRVSKLEAKP